MRLSNSLNSEPKRTFKVSTQDLYALLVTLRGKNVDHEHIDRVCKGFPVMWDDSYTKNGSFDFAF
jgi:hypothetical protein